MEYTIQKFGLLFSIKIKHPYFKDHLCPYLEVEPDPSTKLSFKNNHLITKNYPGEIKIVAPEDEMKENSKMKAKKFLEENKHYTFLLKITDTAFFDVTNLDFRGFPNEAFYFFNVSKTTKLSSKKCFTTDGIVTINYGEGSVPSKITILTQDNVEVYSGDVDKGTKVFAYDLSPFNTGFYTVVSTFPKADKQKPQTQAFYYNSLIRKEPVLGIVDIDTSDITDIESNKNNYEIQLEAPK